jgi:transposase
LLVGYFEGIDSERGIAWRAADSIGLRKFLGVGLDEQTPDHSTISRTRRLIDVETHRKVFFWILELLRDQGLLKGKTVGIDATTLEANAAMRSIVRRDSGESYEEFLKGLAKKSGIETPTREDLARFDRTRKNKASNEDWVNPHDGDARIAKMKDGRTHLAHKAEHAVDLKSGATLVMLKDAEVRTYIPEKKQKGQRYWDGKGEQQQAVYANRRRVNGAYGKGLLRKRGELIERSFAHCYDTGGMRRTHLRGHQNILKRLLLHVGAFNLSLIFRRLLGSGTPREWRNRHTSLLFALLLLLRAYAASKSRTHISFSWPQLHRPRNQRYLRYKLRHTGEPRSATDC